MEKCLGCYLPINKSVLSSNYHQSCSKKLFGVDQPPKIDFGNNDLESLAKQSLSKHLGLTGVQAKISTRISKRENDHHHRMMIVDLWGNYILKPSSKQFPDMSVVEDATMHMASAAGIETALHGLIKLKSGELAYITKRFDRNNKNEKIAVEDFCQLSELLTESKYSASTEKAGKIILKYSSNPGLDAVNFFYLNLFSFLIGNADLHLKNYSLIRNNEDEIILSPAYDLLSTKLMPIDDKEEMALTVNGKKIKLKKIDFESLGKNLLLSEKVINNCFVRLLKRIPEMKIIISNSFLPVVLKLKFIHLIDERAKSLS